ncbi:hypothetical protein T265_06246 [Opisthorchis viverrini]|uniref:Endonuclease/exonuclease/phosphatase domain-containing protein n=1 Tax=Opisthorchis viverrini TaxID=6198 RepID=A0A074ZGX0_OPIVI|nr:hypothetical protein T265_06246 [Opisthorchis viverrini]KER26526.1 hypothetical protein T265_06246 [Opisthorchis viverrini]
MIMKDRSLRAELILNKTLHLLCVEFAESDKTNATYAPTDPGSGTGEDKRCQDLPGMLWLARRTDITILACDMNAHFGRQYQKKHSSVWLKSMKLSWLQSCCEQTVMRMKKIDQSSNEGERRPLNDKNKPTRETWAKPPSCVFIHEFMSPYTRTHP